MAQAKAHREAALACPAQATLCHEPVGSRAPIVDRSNGICEVKIKDSLDNGDTKDKLIVSNLSREVLNEGLLNFNLVNKAVLYGGLGHKVKLEVSGNSKDLPIEPVGVVILGIDGLRQDVLYDGYDASYADPFGCGGEPCYVQVNETNLPGLSQIMKSEATIKLKDVTVIFPSITFASWASIFTGVAAGTAQITVRNGDKKLVIDAIVQPKR